jgi:hypothetical protein
MDTQKVELRALSDDRLDAVSGGNKEDKEQAEALKIFAQVLQKAGQI